MSVKSKRWLERRVDIFGIHGFSHRQLLSVALYSYLSLSHCPSLSPSSLSFSLHIRWRESQLKHQTALSNLPLVLCVCLSFLSSTPILRSLNLLYTCRLCLNCVSDIVDHEISTHNRTISHGREPALGYYHPRLGEHT